MGRYAVPESIRKMKPAGTMVKNISGHYYVYEFKTTTEETGKRKTVMGKCIGSIQSDKGFLPNDNYSRDVEMTSLEFGQYAIVLANTQKTLQILQEFFHPVDALRIYCTAVIHFIHGFTYLTEVSRYYEMSYLSLKYPGLKLIAMYSDEGITATSTEKRIGLLQMLEDAKAGKFDVIIVKNLSRLSRNLMDCMNIIYALRNLPNPVGIFFESENLYTFDKSADFTLQVLSLVAQEESHKKSEAMLASYYMRFSQGQYLVPDLLGYRKIGKNQIAMGLLKRYGRDS